MNQKTFLFISCTLALIVLSGLASAANIEFVPTNLSVSTNPGTNVTVTFSLNNTNSNTAYSLDWTQSSSTIGSWINLPTLSNAVNNTLYNSINAILSVPAGTLPNNYGANIRVRATNSTTTSYDLPVIVSVRSVPGLSISQLTALTRDQNGTINVTNIGNTALTNINLTTSSTSSRITPRFTANSLNLAAGASQLVTIYLANSLSALDLGSITVTAKDLPTSTNSNSLTISLENTRFCVNGTIGDLSITGFDMTNSGEGDDDVWNPLDPIEIEVEIKNNDEDSSVTDVIVEIAILDSNGNDVTDDFNFEDESIDLGKITKDDKEIATFVITDVPSGIDEGDYKIFVKAYKEGDEEKQCVDSSGDLSNTHYEAFSVEKQYDSGVAIRKSDLNDIDASCGSFADLTFDVYNVGTSKEESVLVLIENRELGLSQRNIISDLSSDEKETVSFSISIPQNLTKTSYKISVSTYFDYDGDGDVESLNSYDQNSDDDLEEDYYFMLKPTSCTSSGTQSAISASLKSEAKVGNELLIEATITNPSPSSKDFLITAENYDSWAQLISITPQTVSINAGASQTVLIKFKPTQTGTQTFNIKTLSGSSITTQAVQVSVSEKTGFLTGAFSGGIGSTILYVVIALFVLLILVVLIIIIKVSLSSSKRTSDF